MIEDSINLTGKWIVRSKSDGIDYVSGMELVHHGNRVMGLEEGGKTEYFLEGKIEGNEGIVRYRGILFLDQETEGLRSLTSYGASQPSSWPSSWPSS